MRSTNSNEASDAIRQRLAVHGEAFMDMFDDNEAQQPSHRPRTTAERRQPSDARAGSPSAASTEEVDDLGFLPASQMHGRRQAAGRLPCSGGTAGPEGLSLQKQRRLFMAGRALDSSSSSRTQARRKVGQGPSSKEAEPIATADFERMRREVELLGASGLGKRQRKAFDAERLKAQKGKAEKGPRIPASIGFGLAKKRKQQEAVALEQAIEAGMVVRKGLAKKRKAAEKDRKKIELGTR